MKSEIDIKRAQPVDALILSQLARKTFTDTFAKDNRPEDMEIYVKKTFSEEIQRFEILDPLRRIYLAWQGANAIGYYHVLSGSIDPSVQGDHPIELLRLYVDTDFIGKGLGAMLLQHSMDTAKEEGFKTMWLGVWEHNPRARKFYEQFQFKKVGSHIFYLGNDPQTDLIMERGL